MSTDSRKTSQSSQQGVDGRGDYTVVDPQTLYRGLSYSAWTCNWLNWFLSADADRRNSGPVVFLRSHGLPNKITGAGTSDLPGRVTGSGTIPDSLSTDPNYPMTYVNDPNIRIGGDKLRIFEDQAVFVPIVVAYAFATKMDEQYMGTSYVDLGSLQEFAGSTIDNGDNPPEPSQLTINEEGVKIPQEKMKHHRITTPIFTAVVPDAPYGTSLKDFLEEGSIAPGNYPALVEGYFVILNEFKAPNTYWVHSWASAGREVRGPYFSELVYQIEVVKRPKCDPHGKITTMRPPRNESILKRTLSEKLRVGELTNSELNRFERIYNALSDKKLEMDIYRKMIG
jgi:hypothetical protein